VDIVGKLGRLKRRLASNGRLIILQGWVIAIFLGMAAECLPELISLPPYSSLLTNPSAGEHIGPQELSLALDFPSLRLATWLIKRRREAE
jgi:hypothetical protein